MEIPTTTNQVSTESAASRSQSQLGTDIDSFLLLLTAQITNQDPLAPMDSTAFVSQLAQLTQVEQSITTNTNLENIVRQITSLTGLSDVQLIGRDVTLATNKLDLNAGSAEMQYKLSDNAQQVSIKIKGLDGNIIQEITNLPTSGGTQHTVVWDGLGSNGEQIAAGAYEFELVAVDSELENVSFSSFATTYVEELAFRNGQPTLLLRNNQEVASNLILAVR